MKKVITYIIYGVIIIFLAGLVLFDFNKKDNKNSKSLKKVTLSEVAHTIFYAPMYVSIEKGYFEDSGIDIELLLTPGADKVTAAVLSGDADIGFCGSEATIYVYKNGEKDYLKTFAQLTQKDGAFIVSRKKYDNFTLADLKGKTVIGGRAGGMPEMVFEWALKENGINPKTDLEIDTSVAFPAMSGAFISGNSDFVTLFEPNATEVEQQGFGYVLESVGSLGGNVPYTSFSARKSYIKKNQETIKNFTKAIQKGLDYVATHSDKEVAETILNQFPDTSLNDLESAVKRYRKIEAWPKTTKFSKESFEHLQEIMQYSNALDNKVEFKDLMYEQ